MLTPPDPAVPCVFVCPAHRSLPAGLGQGLVQSLSARCLFCRCMMRPARCVARWPGKGEELQKVGQRQWLLAGR